MAKAAIASSSATTRSLTRPPPVEPGHRRRPGATCAPGSRRPRAARAARSAASAAIARRARRAAGTSVTPARSAPAASARLAPRRHLLPGEAAALRRPRPLRALIVPAFFLLGLVRVPDEARGRAVAHVLVPGRPVESSGELVPVLLVLREAAERDRAVHARECRVRPVDEPVVGVAADGRRAVAPVRTAVDG